MTNYKGFDEFVNDEVNLNRVDLPIFTTDPDQPVACPDCGGRTEFEECDISGYQIHTCLNKACDFKFYTEFDND